MADRRLNLRIRMLGGSHAGYARMTRRWWRPVRSAMEEQGLGDRPVYFVSSNPHSLVNLVTPTARAGEAEIVRFIETHGPEYLRDELERFRAGRAEGSWENFLYFGARLLWESLPGGRRGVAAAPAGRARARRHAHLEPRGAAHIGTDHGAREARPGRARPAARRHRRASGWPPATR